jgi:preprotein translocase subunit SecD
MEYLRVRWAMAAVSILLISSCATSSSTESSGSADRQTRKAEQQTDRGEAPVHPSWLSECRASVESLQSTADVDEEDLVSCERLVDALRQFRVVELDREGQNDRIEAMRSELPSDISAFTMNQDESVVAAISGSRLRDVVEPRAGRDREWVFQHIDAGEGEDGKSPLKAWVAFLAHDTAVVDESHIAGIRLERDVSRDALFVTLRLDDFGRRRFHRATLERMGTRVAYCLGDRVASAPEVQQPMPAGWIYVRLDDLKDLLRRRDR